MKYTIEMLWHGDNPADSEPARWHQETIHNQEIRDGVIVAGFRIVATFPDGFTSIVGQVDVTTVGVTPGLSLFNVEEALPAPNFYAADYPGRVQTASYKPEDELSRPAYLPPLPPDQTDEEHGL